MAHAWFSMNIRNYVLSKIRFGSLEFKYKGNGGEYFVMNLVGYLLTIVTLGIYSFWWQKNLFEYFINNLSLHQEDKEIKFKSTATGGGFFGLMIVNLLIIVCTFGLGYAWAVTRTINFVVNNIELEGNIDLNAISQTETNYTDATGEDINDFLDVDFIM